jgi:hypothetical protein
LVVDARAHFEDGTPAAWSRLPRQGILKAMDPVVRDVLEAAARRDWDTLRLKLHPYIRWKLNSGKTLSGRNAVLAMLAETPPPTEPAAYEVRDGQIYRWMDHDNKSPASARD